MVVGAHIRIVGGGLIAFFVSGTMIEIYDAKVKVLVQGGQTPGAPSPSEIEASRQLARNYGDLITTRPILDKVRRELNLDENFGSLSDKVSVNSPRSLIEIRVKDPDPDLAAELANTIAQIFIDDFRSRQFAQIAQFQSSLNQYGILQDPSIIAAQASTFSR